MSELAVRNRQRGFGVQSRRLKQIADQVLSELHGSDYVLGIHLVGQAEITRLNEQFLKHAGPTDVIAFDHSSGAATDSLYGELFLCVPVAVAQSRRYRIHWPVELVRYLVHGVLHLKGYDDHDPRARRSMKREEGRVLKLLAQRFCLAALADGQLALARPSAGSRNNRRGTARS
jgi:probable rRNA maturation factor